MEHPLTHLVQGVPSVVHIMEQHIVFPYHFVCVVMFQWSQSARTCQSVTWSACWHTWCREWGRPPTCSSTVCGSRPSWSATAQPSSLTQPPSFLCGQPWRETCLAAARSWLKCESLVVKVEMGREGEWGFDCCKAFQVERWEGSESGFFVVVVHLWLPLRGWGAYQKRGKVWVFNICKAFNIFGGVGEGGVGER